MRPLLRAAVVLLAAAGCSSGGDADEAGHEHRNSPVADGARVVQVEATSFEFSLSEIRAEAGEELAIELTAQDAEHDFVIDELDAHVGADEGKSATGGVSVGEEPGELTYYCSIDGHREAGMEGTLVVLPVGGPPEETAPLPQPGEPLADGAHATYLSAVDVEAGTVTVDVIQFLDGQEADDAYAAETGDTQGVPNDYYIRNTTTEERTLPLRDVEVTVAWDADGPVQRNLPIEELEAYLEERGVPDAMFWITVEDGAVVRLEEQYLP